MITLDERVAEFREVVRSCALCPLSLTRTLAVPGEGPVTAEVMCIGEAPGMNEDKQGKPFVGAAGNFLTELLAAAGLAREDVYICNVLKCRPPNNRDPLPEEIEACSEYLDLQLDMVDPLVVVTLGRFSMSKWFPQQAISRIHGTVKEADGRFIVPMYHPAAALHQGSLRQVLLDDFAKLPAILAKARTARSSQTTTPQYEPRTPVSGAMPPAPPPSNLPPAAAANDPAAPTHSPTDHPALPPLPRSAAELGEGPGVRADPPFNHTVAPSAPSHADHDLPPLPRSEGESGQGSGVRADAPPTEPHETEPTAESAPAAKSSQLSLFD